MLLGYLLGLEGGKSYEKERLEAEARKCKEEELTALKEQYMLGLIMPVRGQKSFKVVVREPSLFEFGMVRELLKRIESPIKYFKYYKVGYTHVLEGYYIETGEYKSWKRVELIHTTASFGSIIVFFTLAFIFNNNVLHLEDTNPILFILYQLFSFYFSFIVGAIVDALMFPNKDRSILRYGKI